MGARRLRDIKASESLADVNIGVENVKWLTNNGYANLTKLKMRGFSPSAVLTDEAHHALSNEYDNLFAALTALLGKECTRIGATATPQRLDGKGLGKHYTDIIQGPTIRWLVDNGFLSRVKVFSQPFVYDNVKLRENAGDYSASDQDTALNAEGVIGGVVGAFQRRVKGVFKGRTPRTMIFCPTIAASEHVAMAFQNAGFSARAASCQTGKADREEIVADFHKGKFDILVNVDLFGEGIDVPNLDMVVMLRKTKSITIYLQQCGRVMRKAPGKEFGVLLDLVGNVKIHGFPDDLREWSLEDRPKGESEEVMTKECPECGEENHLAAKFCVGCGHEFASRRVVSGGR